MLWYPPQPHVHQQPVILWPARQGGHGVPPQVYEWVEAEVDMVFLCTKVPFDFLLLVPNSNRIYLLLALL